jgi:hypothetical protein
LNDTFCLSCAIAFPDNFSDEQAEYHAHDRMSFTRFLRLGKTAFVAAEQMQRFVNSHLPSREVFEHCPELGNAIMPAVMTVEVEDNRIGVAQMNAVHGAAISIREVTHAMRKIRRGRLPCRVRVLRLRVRSRIWIARVHVKSRTDEL